MEVPTPRADIDYGTAERAHAGGIELAWWATSGLSLRSERPPRRKRSSAPPGAPS
jgi:hypothetical protein